MAFKGGQYLAGLFPVILVQIQNHRRVVTSSRLRSALIPHCVSYVVPFHESSIGKKKMVVLLFINIVKKKKKLI